MMTRRDVLKGAAAVALSGAIPAGAFARPRSDNQRYCRSNVCFERAWAVGEKNVPLRGVARLTWWGFSVYTSALWLDNEARSIDEVLGDRPRRLVLHYHRSIRARDIEKATEYWVRQNPANNYDALEPRLKTLYAILENVRSGDEYCMAYLPGEGIRIQLNDNAPSAPIPGLDFARAFHGIWLSDTPLRTDVRDRLLSGVV